MNRDLPAVEVRDLVFRYQKAETDALQGISFKVPFGRMSALLGPNGSGKSTAFKIISTQMLPKGGEAFVGGFSSTSQCAELRKILGVTFQSPSLDPMLTVQENLEIHAALVGVPNPASAISEKLKFLGVSDRAGERVKKLSGGLQRRVELAKTLLGEPKVLLLDEPTTGLDPAARAEFWTLLRSISDRGVGILVTTHLMEEAELCDELFFIANGKLGGAGSPQKLKNEFPYEVLWLEGSLSHDELRAALPKEVRIREESGKFRLETVNALDLLDQLRAKFSNKLSSFSWGKASLADVYFEKTGVKLHG